jgi:hypothetical protein
VHHATCDVCGRTLLRGESPEPYVAGGERRWVCDLCTTRALQEGWVREGTIPTYDRTEYARERRRPRLGWLRGRRPGGEMPHAPEISGPAVPRPAHAVAEAPVPAPPREPRHVRAVPTNDEHKVVAAVEAFNSSEHPRTVAGVARSLGSPVVSVRASQTQPSVVKVVAAWELCWYRYEIDLADQEGGVRVEAQGSELSELAAGEHEGNAGADENGLLALKDPSA